MVIDPDASYQATIETSCGTVVLDLFAADSPATVNNFVFLAQEGFYDGVIFHRVIEQFMIQGGDPDGIGTGGPGYRFDDELEVAEDRGYPRGTLAMANSGPNTNGSQFFIMHVDTGLQPLYSVFGEVVDGMDVIDLIANLPTDPGDRPLQTVFIESITIDEVPADGDPGDDDTDDDDTDDDTDS
jgi:cyclophilin family peptidyl-prolyl cis-trans isomerase